ncbi:DUF547 domain-containing protein [Flavobacteriaceae bacterium M23B6Z8]
MKKIIFISTLFFCSLSTFSQSEKDFFEKAHAFFQQHVKDGEVAYAAIHKAPEALNELLGIAAAIKISKSEAAAYRAFWINAYNLAVIKGVIDNYPLRSPLDVKGFFDKNTYTLSGKNITLNSIENEMLRANFNDARIHFVLVCGAEGCPPIINKAYTPDNLESLLTSQTTKALNNPEFIKVTSKKVSLSEIFKWYREDFGKTDKEVLRFVNRFRKDTINSDLKITHYPYNWKLNKQ